MLQHSRWRRAAITLAALTALTTAATGTAAVADSTATDPAAQAPRSWGPEVSVTLVTGDVVQARVDASGRVLAAGVVGADADHTSTVWQDGSSTYVFPEGVGPLIDSGAVDRELFNVTKLIASGYDDGSTDAIPVIVEYAGGRQPRAATPGVATSARLESIGGAGLKVSKGKAAAVWQSWVSGSRTRQASGLTKVWLDEVVRGTGTADLGDPTVPLTGADEAHERGIDGSGVTVAVLDTGYDTTHPDFEGRVVGSQSFVPGDAVEDLNGHGTHTASTVAGTGAASQGRYAGMAPGANLLVGKVLADNGSGSTSWIINGMEWAVAQGADIVSMSLGASGGTSCSGPSVDAVEELSDQALFVIAAGNASLRGTVSTPGCAPSALTVGAIDRTGDTASFSSRGPSVDQVTSKPDIASQGVEVVAAAAGGRGERAYTSMSGTSMATPHVAGGAALVLDAMPGLQPRQLKEVLTSSAADADAPVLEQGAGPLDVARAITQQVVGSPNALLGDFAYPQHDLAPVDATIPLTNRSDQELRLQLALEDVLGDDGRSGVGTMVKLGEHTVVVPAGGTVKVPVHLDPTVALPDPAYGTVTGRLVATTDRDPAQDAAPQQAVVPFAVHVEPPSADLTVVGIDRHGDPAASPSSFQVYDDHRDTARSYVMGYPSPGRTTIRVPYGSYSIGGMVMTRDEPGNIGSVASVSQLLRPTIKVTGDTTVTLDARDAEQIGWRTDRPSEAKGFALGLAMNLDDAGRIKAGAVTTIPSLTKAIYTQRIHADSRFSFLASARLVAPVLTMRSSGGYVVDDLGLPGGVEFDGDGSAELVYIGKGTEANFAAHDIAGKVVLLDASAPGGGNSSIWRTAAANGGAVGVLAAVEGSVGRFQLTGSASSVPMATITGPDSAALQEELAAGPVTMSWSGTATARTPYLYNLAKVAEGSFAGGLEQVHDQNLEQVEARFHTQGPDDQYWSDVRVGLPGVSAVYAGGTSLPVEAPAERVEFFTPSDRASWISSVRRAPVSSPIYGTAFDGPFVAGRGVERVAQWFKAPYGATRNTMDLPLMTRSANRLTVGLAPFGDAGGHDSTADYRDRGTRQVLVDGTPVIPSSGLWVLPQERAQVTLRQDWVRPASTENRVGLAYRTEWTWSSGADTQGAQPLLVPRIDVPSDLRNRIPTGEPVTIGLRGVSDTVRGDVDLDQVTLQYAYGAQADPAQVTEWQDAEVSQDADGAWTGTLPGDAPTGSFVHLRVRMADGDGSTVDEIVVRAFEVS